MGNEINQNNENIISPYQAHRNYKVNLIILWSEFYVCMFPILKGAMIVIYYKSNKYICLDSCHKYIINESKFSSILHSYQ